MKSTLMQMISNNSNVIFKGNSRKELMQIISNKGKSVPIIQKESINCKYGFLIRMNNEVGFKIRHGGVNLK